MAVLRTVTVVEPVENREKFSVEFEVDVVGLRLCCCRWVSSQPSFMNAGSCGNML